MIPSIDRERIIDAMEEFDKTLRDMPEWQGWQNNRAQKWAIDYEGRDYPPKKIISMATGQPVNGFSGGIESNDYLKQRGFKIVSLREGVKSIQEGLETILDGYIPVRESEPFNSRNVIADTFEQVAKILRTADIVRKQPTITTVVSYGKGNWANVPWIAFLDDRETKTTQHGVYVVFLFKEDGTGVYLTYNQGVTDIIKAQGRQLGRERLQQLARERRLECAWLSERGFLLDDTISLSKDAGLGRDYEASTIAHKLYLKGVVPNDDAILKDLEAVLAAYDQYVERKFAEPPTTSIPAQSKGHWLFQVNPKFFDIRRALNNLHELTWTVNQMPEKFRAGQTGYIWEAGTTGGIVAHATLLTDPMEMEANPREEEYSIDPSKFTGKRLRVRVRVDRLLEKPISRQELLEHPTLKSLAILRFANATNYTLSDDEYDAIGSLAIHVEPILDLEAITVGFSNALRESFVDFGLDHLTLVRAFVSSLATKPLVILTGLSGSGKTQLAIRFGEWLGGSRLHVAAVRPDWTGAEALFGYEDALKPLREGKPAWNVPATLAFLLRAAGDPNYPLRLNSRRDESCPRREILCRCALGHGIRKASFAESS
jgi:MrcB-like, N-terminal domain/EVE domain